MADAETTTQQQQPRAFDWRPARLLQDYQVPQDFALLVLNQPLRNGPNLRRLWKHSAVRVAADGGANRLHALSTFHGKFSNLQAIVGDLDSLSPLVRDFYLSQPTPTAIVHIAEQDSTDFMKAVKWLREAYHGIDIVAVGGLGGRVDQGISQLHQLYLFHADPAYANGRIYLFSGGGITFLLKPGKHSIQVREEGEVCMFGKYVGIIPLRDTAHITTKGLEWDVEDWETCIGGQLSTSNHVLPDTQTVVVETDKDVLFTISLAQVDGEEFEQQQ